MSSKLLGIPSKFYPKKWGNFIIATLTLIIFTFIFSAFQQESKMAKEQTPDPMETFQMEDLLTQLKESGRPYLPFLTRESLRCGIYTLASGAVDQQNPHDLDEVYYVLNGKGRFTVEGEEVEVKEGTVLFVEAHAKHAFHDIEEDLELLVFFSTSQTD